MEPNSMRTGRRAGGGRLFVVLPLLLVLRLSGSAVHAQEEGDVDLEPPVGDEELDELLDLSLEELMDVEITTASKQGEKIFFAPATVRVVSGVQIQLRGALSLEEALANLPGLQYRNLQGLNSYIFMRGVPNQNNLILMLVDGILINELNSGGFYGGNHYNLANVKRIELVYGPSSALYGTNAVSGIVNIITKDPQDDPGLTINTLYGSFDTWEAGLSYSYHDPESPAKFGFRVSGMFKRSEKMNLAGTAGDDNWTTDMELFEEDYAGDLKIRFYDFTLGVNYQNRRSSTSTYFKSVGTDYRDQGTLWNIHFINAYLKHSWDITETVQLRSQLYYRNATVDSDSIQKITDDGQFGYYRPNHLLGLEGTVDATPLEGFNIVGGLVLEYERLADGYSLTQSADPEVRPERPDEGEMADGYLLSGYLQLKYLLMELVQFHAGVRIDHSRSNDFAWTPRAGVVLHWEGLTAKVLYGEAFRAPRPWDYTNGLGNSSLDPERMRSVEVSVGYLLGDYLNVETTFYFNMLYDGLVKRNEDDGSGWRWTNATRIDTYGVETSVSAGYEGFQAFVNHTYTYSRDAHGDRVPEIAEHTANFGVGYTFPLKISLQVWGNLTGSKPNPKVIAATGDDWIDLAFVLNGSISLLDFQGFDFQLFVKNALNAKYYHSSNRAPDRYRQPQRSILGRIRYRF